MTRNNKEFYKKLIRLALPIAFQQLMLAAVAAGDAFMLSQSSQDAMAAVSLATQIQFVQNMALEAAVGAGAILGAQYFGKKDLRSLNDIFLLMLRVSIGISVLFFIGCVFFPEKLMLIYAKDTELIAIGADYLRIAGWSYLLTGISQSYLTLMKVTDHVAASAYVSTMAVVLNLILNGILIFGLLGFPVLGAEGAAIATLIARIIELLTVILLSFRKKYYTPDLKRFFRGNRLLTKDFMRCALPLFGGATCWGIGFTGYTAIVGHLGKDAAAANSIAAVVRDLSCCFCRGISAAGGIMVGNELGAGRLDEGRNYGKRLARISVLIGVLCMVLILALTPFILRFTHLNGDAARYLLGMMVIMAVYMVGRNITTVTINGVFAAGGDTMFDVYSLAVMMWGVAIPLAVLGAFVFHWPVLAVYACTCLDEIGKLPWVMLHFRKYKWVKDLTRDTA